MSINVNSIDSYNKIFDNINFSDASKKSDTSSKDSFLNILESKLDDVNDKLVNSDNITQQYIEGDDVDIHQVLMAGEEAKMSLDLALQVRNKLIDAYQELNKTQI